MPSQVRSTHIWYSREVLFPFVLICFSALDAAVIYCIVDSIGHSQSHKGYKNASTAKDHYTGHSSSTTEVTLCDAAVKGRDLVHIVPVSSEPDIPGNSRHQCPRSLLF